MDKKKYYNPVNKTKNLPFLTKNILNLITFFNAISNNNVNASSENVLTKLKTINNFNQSQNASFNNLSQNIISNDNHNYNNDIENEFIRRYHENYSFLSQMPSQILRKRSILRQSKEQISSNNIPTKFVKSPSYNQNLNRSQTYEGKVAIINTTKIDDSNKYKFIYFNNTMERNDKSYSNFKSNESFGNSNEN